MRPRAKLANLNRSIGRDVDFRQPIPVGKTHFVDCSGQFEVESIPIDAWNWNLQCLFSVRTNIKDWKRSHSYYCTRLKAKKNPIAVHFFSDLHIMRSIHSVDGIRRIGSKKRYRI